MKIITLTDAEIKMLMMLVIVAGNHPKEVESLANEYSLQHSDAMSFIEKLRQL